MSNPAIDALNEAPGKAWWRSKTIWGLAITAISIAAPKYQPIAQLLPPVVDQVGEIVGLLVALYGRLKAEKPLAKS
jgi:hypothetical protein